MGISMRSPRWSAAAGACVVATALSACGSAPLGTLEPAGPYSADEVSALAPLFREGAVPLVVIGSTVYVPSAECAGPSERLLGGADQGRALDGADENRRVSGDGENRSTAGADEQRRVAGEDEQRRTAGAGETRRVDGEGEARRAGGAAEDRSLDGDGEQRTTGGAGEDRQMAGGGEERGLGGATQALRCRREGDSAFYILNHERLQPKVYLGERLEDVREGYVRY